MNNLYIITGPAGVGKSTVSREIAKTLEKSVLIEGDDIYHLVVGGHISPWKTGNHLKLFWKNCFSIIQNSLDDGYDVVFNYVIYNKNIQQIKKQFPDANTSFTVLMADEKTLIQRDNLRPQDSRMGKRSLTLLKNFKEEFKNSPYIIDTSNLSVSEIVSKIRPASL